MSAAAIYVRISRDSEGQGLGVERQETACRAEALKHGHSDPLIFKDNDVSAYKESAERPDYERLLAAIKAGQVSEVFVWHTDRLHRQTTELETYIKVASHIPTRSVEAGFFDLSTPSGRAVAKTLGAWAQYESEHKAARLKAKHEQLRLAGRMVGARSFGWSVDVHNRLTGDLEPQESALLREAAERLLEGGSLYNIAEEWNANGITTTRGGKWTHSNLRIALTNPKIAGLRAHEREVVMGADGQPVVGQWEAILTIEEWQQVKAVVARKKHMRAGSSKHLLGGLIHCQCGGVMYGCAKAKQATLYQCNDCRAAIAEPKVMPQVIRAVSAAILFGVPEPHQGPESPRKSLTVRLSDLQTAKANLLKVVEAGVWSLQEISANKKDLDKQIEEATQELDSLSAAGSSADLFNSVKRELFKGKTLPFSDAVEAKKQISAGFQNLSFERKRALIRAHLKVTVKPGRGADRVSVENMVFLEDIA